MRTLLINILINILMGLDNFREDFLSVKRVLYHISFPPDDRIRIHILRGVDETYVWEHH